jgi:hypothetical protein
MAVARVIGTDGAGEAGRPHVETIKPHIGGVMPSRPTEMAAAALWALPSPGSLVGVQIARVPNAVGGLFVGRLGTGVGG